MWEFGRDFQDEEASGKRSDSIDDSSKIGRCDSLD